MENVYKTAVIVGASSGIGLETAKLLIKNNYKVVNISRSNAPQDSGIIDILADAAIENSLFDAIESAAGIHAIDVFVYCAGWSMASPIEFAAPGDYRYLFEVNFFGILESMRAVIPHMKEKGGRIILVSSIAGTLPIAFDAFYSASKAAVDSLAQSADIELKPYKIRVCAVKPAGVNTRFTFKRKVYGDERIGEYADKQHRAVAEVAISEQGGIEASKVAQTIYSVITAANPPTKKVAGFMGKTYYAASKILPDRVVTFFNSHKYDQ